MDETFEKFEPRPSRVTVAAMQAKEIKQGSQLLARVQATGPVDRKAALKALREIGPVQLPARK